MNTAKKPTINFPEKLVNKLAKDSEDWMNYVDLDLPSQITSNDFQRFVINDPQGNPKIKKMWNSLSTSQKLKLYNLVVDVLEKKEGSDDLFESVNLSKIAKRLMEDDASKQEKPSQQPEDRFEWENDPYHSRRFEKSDVSWREYDMDMNPQSYRFKEGEEEEYRPGGKMAGQWYQDREDNAEKERQYRPSYGHSNRSNMVGITFFEVPSGNEKEATRLGLTQFKRGKWGVKHQFDKHIISVASDREKSMVSAAERRFGKGRYWEPKK
jgi:hypothetical protein